MPQGRDDISRRPPHHHVTSVQIAQARTRTLHELEKGMRVFAYWWSGEAWLRQIPQEHPLHDRWVLPVESALTMLSHPTSIQRHGRCRRMGLRFMRTGRTLEYGSPRLQRRRMTNLDFPSQSLQAVSIQNLQVTLARMSYKNDIVSVCEPPFCLRFLLGELS